MVKYAHIGGKVSKYLKVKLSGADGDLSELGHDLGFNCLSAQGTCAGNVPIRVSERRRDIDTRGRWGVPGGRSPDRAWKLLGDALKRALQPGE